ncbi:MAG: helix-turn-helix domain-containing protein [Cycloclasticus sp.]
MFRADLYYRLSVIPFTAPPLRERTDDIEALVNTFIDQLCEEHELPKPPLTATSIELLKKQPWPGNIRELRNQIERSLLLNVPLHDKLLTPEAGLEPTEASCLKSHEKTQILKAISESNGNKSQAASTLGISRRTLDRKLKRWREAAA